MVNTAEFYHIYPMNDLEAHEFTSKCPCDPEINDKDHLVIHKAYDGRDLIERYGLQ